MQARNTALNKKHKINLTQIRNALEAYGIDHDGMFPPSAPGFNGVYLSSDSRWDSGPVTAGNTNYYRQEWIPGLVSGGYIPSLPSSSTAGSRTSPYSTPTQWGDKTECNGYAPAYYYRSDSGYAYKIIVRCPEGGTDSGGLIDPIRPGTAYAICYAPETVPGGMSDAGACTSF